MKQNREKAGTKTKKRRTFLSMFLAGAVSITSLLPGTSMQTVKAEGIQGKAAEPTVVSEIDFTQMNDLNNLGDKWTLTNGSGTSELVTENNEKALKMTRGGSGNEMSLVCEGLGITESQYQYVSIETELKLGSETHANQVSIPYIYAKDSTAPAYTFYTTGDWSQYTTHINGKNERAAGKAKPGEWQKIRMDIDLSSDTFRIVVDGECLVNNQKARAAAENLDKLKFYIDSWNAGTLYFKSIKVTGQNKRTEAATFYVSNSGDDSNEGTSENAAWKTIERVNREIFIPGDQIKFQAGGTWEGESLYPQGSGTAEKKIAITSYGEGSLPKIATKGKYSDAIFLCNQEYWEISNLDISNTVEGFTQLSGNGKGDGTAPAANNAARDENLGKLLGDFRGIHIAGCDVASLKGFHLHDLLVHDVTGIVSWIGTNKQEAGIVSPLGCGGSKRTGGVLIECLQPAGNQPTQFSDIMVEDSRFINNSFGGITVRQWNGSGNQDGENPGWANRHGHKGAPDYVDDNWYPHSNIRIQNNYINQGASGYACNGIYLTSARDSLIQGNVLEHIGTCGVELYFADNVVVQYNEVSDVIVKAHGADSNAIDPDWRVTNALIQYNYVHDCGEGFLLCGVQLNSGIIRYNLVQDCKASYVHYSMGSGYFQLYNNVFYRSADGNGTSNFDPWGGGKVSYVNNVFYDGKKQGFNFSGGSSFAFDNNAYYGTAPTSKDQNAIVLTEDPFEGNAPSLDRKGNFESGPLLEANGLKPKKDSPLIAAGKTVDPLNNAIDDGLKSSGTNFNFTPAAQTAQQHWTGDIVNIARSSYPEFEQTGTSAALKDKKHVAASDTAPTIGMFEVPLDQSAVILRGNVSDGLHPVAGATMEITSGGQKTTVVTNDAGNYSVTEGLTAGQAAIVLKREGQEDVTETVNLEGGKVTVKDFTVPMAPMPDEYGEEVVNESFDAQTSPENFGFDKGTAIENGKLVLTKDMGNNQAAVKTFSDDISSRKGVDISFKWKCGTSGDKLGFQFRDTKGELLFAVCAALKSAQFRTSTTADAVANPAEAASKSEPKWTPITLEKDKDYTIRIHADFVKKQASYSVINAEGKTVVQELDVPVKAQNLGTMIACSWYESKPQYLDDFRITATAIDKTELTKAIAEAEALEEKDYTAESWTAFQEKLQAAKTVEAKADASSEEIRTAYIELAKAQTALVKLADKTELNTAITEAEALKEADYIAESWTPFQEKLQAAKEIAAKEDATQKEVDDALDALKEAKEALVKNDPEPGTIDKPALDTAITEAEALEESDFTAESWAAFQEKLKAAKEIAAKEDATPEEIAKAYNELDAAREALVSAETPTVVDKPALNTAITEAETLKESEYTVESWKAFQEKLKAAKEIAAKEGATPEEITKAYNELDAAKKALQKNSSGGNNPGGNNPGGNNPGSSGGNTPGGSGDNNNSGGSGETSAPAQKVTKIKFETGKYQIAAGKKVNLGKAVTTLPKDAENKQLTWQSSNQKYVSVSGSGMVTAKKAGIGKKVTITATAKDGSNVKAKVTVQVMKHAVKKVSLKAKTKTLKAGKKLKVTAKIKTSGKKVNKKLAWKTSNKKYAVVNSKGVVTAKKAGKGKTVTITATSTDGTNKKGTIKIKIKK